MKYRLLAGLAVLSAVLTLPGCAAAPAIVKSADNNYTVSRVDRGGSFDEIASTRQALVAEADRFAAAQGKVAVRISMTETPMQVQGYTTVDYKFQLLNKSEADAIMVESTARATGVPASVVIQNNELVHSGAVYDALIKLDDLHKRGILTDDEFAGQKKKILNSN